MQTREWSLQEYHFLGSTVAHAQIYAQCQREWKDTLLAVQGFIIQFNVILWALRAANTDAKFHSRNQGNQVKGIFKLLFLNHLQRHRKY